ncbi:MAG: TetR/AcrR family transcriptional regulator [Bacteroidetes bacterium]|jgi:AcrR family transcriptional regulator|nr:MAG: TetR/AcrR family transcriptional regulator [Bacteroidota bacterium]
MSTIKRKKASRKSLILQKAAAMFREKGYAATSMRDLADTVGIEAASLYNHIKSKAEMLQEIIFRIANDAYVQLDDLEDEGLSPLQKIESIMRFHIKMNVERFEEYHVMVTEWIHLEDPYLANFTSQRRNYVQKLEAIIQQGIDNKEMQPVLPYVAVLNILSSIRGIEFWHRSRKTYSAEQIEENMVSHLLNGLKK